MTARPPESRVVRASAWSTRSVSRARLASLVTVARGRLGHFAVSQSFDAVGEQSHDAVTVVGMHELVEALADPVVDVVAQHPLDGRADIPDRGVRLDHGDQVARVLHERTETRLATTRVHRLGQDGALERQGDLHRHGLQRVPDLAGEVAFASDQHHAAELLTNEERERQAVIDVRG